MANLLSPIKINSVEVKNRIVMPPLASRGATNEGEVTEKVLQQYKNRPGVGLIIVEHTYVNPRGRVNENQLGLYKDDLISGISALVDIIKENDSIPVIQLTHGGSAAAKKVINDQPLAPSAVVNPGKEVDDLPQAMSQKDMEKIKQDFVQAAERAKKAGFEMIEIHGAHGYLLNQFFSPITNKREDKYGGDFINRLRFPLEIIRAVRKKLGDEFPILYRLGCDDFIEGGLTVEDGIKAAPHLEKAGIDLLDLSGGLKGYGAAPDKQGFFLYLSEAIKPEVNIPVLVTGGIKDPEFADRIVRESSTDLVGVGRAMLKDRQWAQKAISSLT